MPTKITVIYDNPTDPAAFEAGYAGGQVALAKALPGLQSLETSKVWPKEDGSPTPAYRMVDLYFPDYDTASAAVATAEAAALFPSIFGLATGGVRILFSEGEEAVTSWREARPRRSRDWDILLPMGKLNLGLDDRSARLIHGRDVWTEIRGLLTGYSAVSAAIAFVGPEADQHLPLRGPATIVVNAGDDALASGWTDPQVLLRWTRRGVRVYSLESLHAKVVLAEGYPSFVLIGSADVLSPSGRILDEAVLVADERETVDELRDAIAGWRERAGEPLTEAWLQAAGSRYHPAAPHRLPVAHTAAPAVGGAPVADSHELDNSFADPAPAVRAARPAMTPPLR